MRVHLTRVSRNSKTGPIPVSTTTRDSCPDSCPFKGAGCYAEQGKLAMHWNKVSSGERDMGWDEFVSAVRRFPRGQLWRHNQAGDLPGGGDTIDVVKLSQLAAANKGRRGFTYTHKPPTPENLQAIGKAVAAGFTINLSANSLQHADELARAALPLVAVVPENAPAKGETPAGRKYLVCPAQTRDDVTCASCGLCQNADERRPIIAFRAHGARKKTIEAMLV